MFIINILYETLNLFLEMAPYLFLGLFFVVLLNLIFSKSFILRHVGKNSIGSVLKASIFGIPIPLCSCGVIPTSVYLSKNGASRGAVVSFLTSTPQTGIDSLIATYGMMGWVFAIYRPLVALVMGIINGTVVRIMDRKEAKVNTADKVQTISYDSFTPTQSQNDNQAKPSFQTRIIKSLNYAYVEFLDDISIQFVVGLFISGIITYLIPEGFFRDTSVNQGIFGMLIMMAVGIPMYVCATASIPIAVTLMLKGFSPGVAFVFLVTGPATNAASLTILYNTLGRKITIAYVAVIAICSILFGYLLDFVFAKLAINPVSMFSEHAAHHHGSGSDTFNLIIASLFGIAVLASLFRKLKNRFSNNNKDNLMETIKIKGMTCNHCVMNVSQAVKEVAGVQSVEINLSKGEAYVGGSFEVNKVNEAISKAGYTVV